MRGRTTWDAGETGRLFLEEGFGSGFSPVRQKRMEFTLNEEKNESLDHCVYALFL